MPEVTIAWKVNIDLGDGSAPTRQQAITLADADPELCHIMPMPIKKTVFILKQPPQPHPQTKFLLFTRLIAPPFRRELLPGPPPAKRGHVQPCSH